MSYQEIVEREQKYLLNTYARYPDCHGTRQRCVPV